MVFVLYVLFLSHSLVTGCMVVQHFCKGDQPFQWEDPKFDPMHIPNHLIFYLNFARMITSGISPGMQNLVKLCSQGASPRIGEK